MFSGPPRSMCYRARSIAEAKPTGAVIAKPNQDVWCISPKERTDPPRNLHSVVDRQTLKRLDVERPIIKFALCTLVSVNTLPFTKHLSGHKDLPFLSRHIARNTESLILMSGLVVLRERERGKRIN